MKGCISSLSQTKSKKSEGIQSSSSTSSEDDSDDSGQLTEDDHLIGGSQKSEPSNPSNHYPFTGTITLKEVIEKNEKTIFKKTYLTLMGDIPNDFSEAINEGKIIINTISMGRLLKVRGKNQFILSVDVPNKRTTIGLPVSKRLQFTAEKSDDPIFSNFLNYLKIYLSGVEN